MALLGGELEEADALGLVGAGAGHAEDPADGGRTPDAIRAQRDEQLWMAEASWGEMLACGIGLFASAAVVNRQTFNFFRFHESKMLQGDPVVFS